MKGGILQPTGEYAVGTFTYTVADDREELLRPSAMRSVACRVYYPVLKSDTAGCKKAAQMSRNMARAIRKAFWIPLNYNKMEAAGENVSACYENAPRIEGRRFPLIVFHHGYNSYREGNSFLCIDLASHGYAVISVAHSLEGLCTEFDDGSCLFYEKSLTRKTYQPFLGGLLAALRLTRAKGTPAELAEQFDAFQSKYCRFHRERVDEWVKDTKAALRYAKEKLTDLIDFEKGVGVTGHSFGGDVAYALCLREPEFACGVNIDGAPFGDYRDAVLEKPFMQISCKDNENLVARVYLRHTQPVWKVLFRQMKHVGFSDMKHRLRSGLLVGRLNADVLHENLCRCHLELFDAYLKRTKARPDIGSNDAITVTEFAPDMRSFCGEDGRKGETG